MIEVEHVCVCVLRCVRDGGCVIEVVHVCVCLCMWVMGVCVIEVVHLCVWQCHMGGGNVVFVCVTR